VINVMETLLSPRVRNILSLKERQVVGNREVAHVYSIGLFNWFAGASASPIPEKRVAF